MKGKGTRNNLKRMRLVNWYGFTDQIFEFGEVTLITGNNGVGKTTINDAIMYDLTHDRRGFNMGSGHEKGDRNLAGFVRGRLGSEHDDGREKFLREDSKVASFVIIELSDGTCCGVHILVNAANKDTCTFFHTKKGISATLEEIPIADENGIMSVKVIRENPKLCIEESIRGYDTYLSRSLRITDMGSFAANFKRAMAYRTDGSIKDFINDCLFPKKDVDTESFSSLVKCLSDAQEKFNFASVEKEMVEKVKEEGEKYAHIKASLESESVLKILAHHMERKDRAERLDGQAREKDGEAEKEDAAYEAKRKELEQKRTEISTIRTKIRNEYGNTTAPLDERIDKATAELKTIEGQEKELRSISEELAKAADTISPQGQDSNAELASKLRDAAASILSDSECMSKEEWDSIGISNAYDAALVEKNQCRIQKEKAVNERAEKEKELAKLNSGNGRHDATEKFISLLMERAKREGVDARGTTTLDEQISWIDEDWRPVLEHLLRFKKDNIIVPSRAYALAIRCLKESPNKGIRIVDTSYGGITSKRRREGTLKDAIRSENTQTDAYLNYLVGSYAMADERTIRSHDMAATKDGLIKNGAETYSIRTEPLNILGEKGIKNRAKALKGEIDSLSSTIRESSNAIDNCDRIIRHLGSLRRNTPNSSVLQSHMKAESLRASIKEAEKLREELSLDQGFSELNEKLEKAIKKAQALESEESDIKTRRDNARNEANGNRTMAGNIRKEMESDEWSCSECDDEQKERAESELGRRLKGNRTYKTIAAEADKKAQDLHSQKIEKMIEVKRRMREYNQKFGDNMLGEDPDASMEGYLNKWERIRDSLNGELQSSIEEKKEQLRDCLLDKVLGTLRDQIEDAHKYKDEVNRKLRMLKFEDDTYQVCLEKTKDPKYSKIRSIIDKMDESQYGNTPLGAFNAINESEPELRETLEDFLQILQDGGDKSAIDDYVDYRSYMDIDIKIRRNGEDIRMKKKAGSDSGGEFQTPYYIIIAAGLMANYSEEGNGLRLICIDEAFNRMTDDRIQEMIGFMRDDCGMQIIITAPTNESSKFNKLVDAEISLAKDRNNLVGAREKMKNEVGTWISVKL